MKELKARNEKFGKTVFDPNSFKHKFMSDEEFEELLKENFVQLIGNDQSGSDSRVIVAPIRAYYDITYACNLRCRTCLNESSKASEDELNLENALRVVEGLAQDGVFDIRFSGGEPTQKEGWDLILSRAKELGLAISLNTNGIYSPENLERLIKINPDEVTVSLDGYGAYNDQIRGRGSYLRASEAIKKISEAGCRVTINSVMTRGTSDGDILNLLAFASEYCADISFFHPRPLGRVKRHSHLLLDFGSLDQLTRRVDELKAEFPAFNVRTRSSSLHNNAIGGEAEDFGLMVGGSDGFTRFNIMPNGSMYAGGCVLYVSSQLRDELNLGNIVDEGFTVQRVWHNSPKLWEIRYFSSGLKDRCDACTSQGKSCPGFTLEMEYLALESGGKNIYCEQSV